MKTRITLLAFLMISVMQISNAAIITLEGELAWTLNGPQIEGDHLGFVKAIDADGLYCATCSWVEWEEVNIPTTGTYNINYYTSGYASGNQVKLVVDGVDKGITEVPSTGGWSPFIPAPGTATLTAGIHKIRIYFTSSTSNIGFLCNFDKMTLELGPTGLNDISDASVDVYPVPATSLLNVDTRVASKISLYDICGKLVYNNQSGALKSAIDVSNYNKGLYMLKIETNSEVQTRKVSIK